jgi:hypothetical protein
LIALQSCCACKGAQLSSITAAAPKILFFMKSPQTRAASKRNRWSWARV